ncbi:AMP-dependent synthetase [Sulfurimicrobium lacus]|uniref:AMP-dependent synthetase n=1 Tax=Sulfurimicrobium lacus TaxID=2715678 RepID=A0A6F8V9G5_9PROT|nr:AMP-binding protein [Sulfurimicrobium lacus]BCB25612.1 AMP-dependent synthetase [Sulfurimicrobium lacus]
MTNLAQLLAQHLSAPERVLYSQFVDGEWRDYSVLDVVRLAARWQQALRRDGLQAGERVAICLRNSVNWVAVDMAALGLGLVVVPLYVDDNPENIAWCLQNSGARLVVMENSRQRAALQAAMQAPSSALPRIICLQDGPGACDLADWLPADAAAFEVRPLEPGTLATIVYTSGTSGRPKGVMLSHRNILANVAASSDVVRLRGADSLLSVLPLSHMFERTCGYYLPLSVGIKVAYARGIQQIAEDLAFHRPTVLIAVPRVFERFLARLEKTLAQNALKRVLFRLTVHLGWRRFKRQATLAERGLYRLLQRFVAAPILERLGGRLCLAVVGGAKVELRIARTFIGLGLNLIQGYGLTEAAPVVAANREEDNDPATVGAPLKGIETRINEAGELLVRGPSVMLGYWQNPEASAAVMDTEGWLNTGDLAAFSAGKIVIRGRSKDVLILSSGEKAPPQDIEIAILDDPVFEQAMLLGEGKAFFSLLAVTAETDDKMLVRRANAQLKSFPRYIRVRRVIPLSEPWTVENGLLTPTQKVKREAVLERFGALIEEVYR